MTAVHPVGLIASPAPSHEPPPSMVGRITLILDAFDDGDSRLTVEEVARRAQLPRSTVHRILDQLMQLNWVEHTRSGYCLGRRALGLGSGEASHDEIRTAAAPLLHELHLQTGMVVHLTVLSGSESVYLDKIGGRFATTLPSMVGGRRPAHSTAGGKSMLAWLDPERVDNLYNGRLGRRTEQTITDISTLHQELHRIRQRRGLAFDHGESVRGVACVGAAVRGQSGPIAGISLCGDARTVWLERVAPLVVDAAKQVSQALSSAPSQPWNGDSSYET
ncbi:IclR family transcriptional regulator [Rhodococcus sp. ACT016]|uniref:IclR family transcriptional regulator n=1 Tax=Rhodococcus sp. ACT016 TaxID=3134808 RepID=UPI003D29CCA5